MDIRANVTLHEMGIYYGVGLAAGTTVRYSDKIAGKTLPNLQSKNRVAGVEALRAPSETITRVLNKSWGLDDSTPATHRELL